MGADAIIEIVCLGIAAGGALLSTCATPKTVADKGAVIGQEERVEEKSGGGQTALYPADNSASTTDTFKPVSQPVYQPETKSPQAPTQVETKVLVPTGAQTPTTPPTPPSAPEPPKESMQDAFIKRYLKAYYTGDSAYVISKNVEDLEKDQGLKELMIQDVKNAQAEADEHGGFQEVEIKNATQKDGNVEFEVNIKFKDGTVAKQNKYMATQINKVWKAY